MQVVKRDGRREDVHFDKITTRLKRLCEGLDRVDCAKVAQKVVSGVFGGVLTTDLDTLASETSAGMAAQHPQYSLLAGRICTSNLHKQTVDKFSDVVKLLHGRTNCSGEPCPAVSGELFDICSYGDLDGDIDHSRDMDYDFFAAQTLMRSYLLRDVDGKILERPQHMLMRVAVGIHGHDLDKVRETYSLMSQGVFTHATPTMFNAGTPSPQMSSCFLTDIMEDSIDGIYDTVKRCALISKFAGGIGFSASRVRASGTFITGSGGTSNGLVPMLKVFDATARYVDQGGGKRKGAFAVYLEPWHLDVEAFLKLRLNTGKHEDRARDLFYGMWIPDIFMERVERDAEWSLFCPSMCPGLVDTWGRDFEELYLRYESEGKSLKTVRARAIWRLILDAQIETGTPYMLYKDACNSKSNQQHLGTIKCSNLCTEIIQYSSANEVAVCNLASIALPKCVHVAEDGTRFFCHRTLMRVTRAVATNLDLIIDRNRYPVEEARKSNMAHRPIGIGVQGLADVFMLLQVPFDSDEARQLNRDIFETIYFAALTESCSRAVRLGTYPTFAGSPASQGRLQHDLWGVCTSDRWDWAQLRADIATHGLRNSLLVAPMPTATTAQILGNTECIEPYTTNMYTRRVISGEFVVTNKHLVRTLEGLGMWNDSVRAQIMRDHGSVKNLHVSDSIKQIFRTAWEIKMKPLIDMAADRAPFIDQSQSLNAFVAEPTHSVLSSMHFHAWKRGLKTGMYYLRSQPAASATQFTVPQVEPEEKPPGEASCSIGCESCSS